MTHTPIFSLIGLATISLLASNCASEEPLCAQANSIVDQCNVPFQTNPFTAENACSFEDTQDRAKELISLYDDIGCDGIKNASERADGCLFCRNHVPTELEPFTTDGCSMFPDGTIDDPQRWQQCCVTHDYAYYVGGTREMKKAADVALGDCIADVCSSTLGDLMYYGVRVGGTPALPSPWRWGYGWGYDPFNGFRNLPDAEFSAAMDMVDAYIANPTPPDALEQTLRSFAGQELNETVDEFNKSLICD